LKSEKYRQNTNDMQDNSIDIADFAKKQRFTALVKKMKDGKALNSAEIAYLEKFEMAKKKKENQVKPNEIEDTLLSLKEETFCREYIIDFNATRAARAAKYSKKTAAQQAVRMLRKVKIQKFIDSLKAAREKRTDIKADRVLEELAKLTFSNIADFIEIQGGKLVMKDLATIPREQLACIEEISEIETERGLRRFKFKLHSKDKALELAMKHLGLLEENINLKLPEGCGVLAVPVGLDKKLWSQFAKNQQSQKKQ